MKREYIVVARRIREISRVVTAGSEEEARTIAEDTAWDAEWMEEIDADIEITDVTEA